MERGEGRKWRRRRRGTAGYRFPRRTAGRPGLPEPSGRRAPGGATQRGFGWLGREGPPRAWGGGPTPWREGGGPERLGSGGLRRRKGLARGAQPGLLTRSPRPGRRRARGWSRAPPGSRAGGGRGRLSGGRLGRPCEVRDVQRENNTNLEINQVTPATSVRLFLPLPSGCRPPLTRCWVTRRLLLAAPASPPLLVRTGSE